MGAAARAPGPAALLHQQHRGVLGERRGAEAATHGDAEAHPLRLAVGAHQVHQTAGLGRTVQQLGRASERVRPVEAGGDQHLAQTGGGHHPAAVGADDDAGTGAPQAPFALFGHQRGLGGPPADAEAERRAAGLGQTLGGGLGGDGIARWQPV